MRVVLVVVLLALGGCRCKPTPVEVPAVVKVPRVTTTWAPHEVAAVPDDVYGVPAWSKVFALAFERKISIGVPSCHVDGGCLAVDPMQLRGAPMVSQERILGRDEPLAFIGEQVTFLEAPDRRARLDQAIAEAMTIDPSTAPLAAVLFQNDLWERVDAITAAIRNEPGADWAVLQDLRKKLVTLMKRVALTKEQLATIASNESAVTRRYAELLAGFGERDGWAELVSQSTEHRGSTVWQRTTRHAERHGYRSVFRVFIHHAQGRAVLSQALTRWPEPLPAGTRFVITGAPMALLTDGSIEPAPFITLLETRQARAEGFIPTQIGTLDHDVLEGSRVSLTRDSGGLERLGRDALIPVGATCMPDFTSRLPSASTCLMCHGPTGARITGPMAHGETRFELTDDQTAAARAVADAKRASESFQTLGW
ncbi:MAG: hypothetical protein Q8L14_32685 [Myxococcales bacterium]|nr:hypothetical protein [Myxococcales bacterium]